MLEQSRTGNEAYLAAAIAWLRLRLRQSAPSPPATDEADGNALAQAASDMAAAEGADSPPALVQLSRQLGLSRFEQQTLLLCAAMELDTGIASLCACAQGDASLAYPTFALAMTLFDDPAWDVMSPERPLRYWQLIEIHQPPGRPLTASALCADEYVVNYIKGLHYLDDRLARLLAPLDVSDDGGALPPSQQSTVETIVQCLRQASRAHLLPVFHLAGPDTHSKQLVASRAADALGLELYRLCAGALPQQAAEMETLARLWQRASRLLPIALYLDPEDGEGSLVHRFVARVDGLVFLDTREAPAGAGWDRLTHTALLVDIAKPTTAEQQSAWHAALGELANDNPARLAGQFNLGLATIAQLAQAALAETAGAPDGECMFSERLWDACRCATRPRLDTLAQRLDAKATWDDIVLAPGSLDLLHQVAGQVGCRTKVYQDWGFDAKMNRGHGISAVFTGESGTGKTMAAEVIANALRLNLYRIDLSAVVSKYIGETEKNLRRLFDAAEDGGAILFFDEADALFGKRSEVRDSHDRYANVEIDYLLQRMESYRGLAILATNLKGALDPAFVRRLRFVVNFAFPGHDERHAIWQKAFPPQTPRTAIDFERLARFTLTGGSIHNVALNAAFLAARAGTPVTMSLVLDAVRTEFRKLEKPVNESELGLTAPVRAQATIAAGNGTPAPIPHGQGRA
jgi:hypothetical protein